MTSRIIIGKPDHRHLPRYAYSTRVMAALPYCMPVLNTAMSRDAARKAATSGGTCYFLDTDSAPHAIANKLSANGLPGLFNAPVAIETCAKLFEEEGALRKLEVFASLNGPVHYRLPSDKDTITLEKAPWTAPVDDRLEGPDEKLLIYRGDETIEWKVVAN